MSEIAMNPRRGSQSAFRSTTMFAVVAVGILAFAAMLVLGAYAPDMRSGKNGGAHALSNGATGFAAIVRLAQATGRNPRIVRNAGLLDSEDLAVLTPESGRVNLDQILDRRGAKATLIILPKWETVADKLHSGWVRMAGLLPPVNPAATLAPAHKVAIGRHRGQGRPLHTNRGDAPPELRFKAPGAHQSVSGPGLKPIISDEAGRAILVQIGDAPLYVLADPDLLSNHGMADSGQAAAALALLDFLNSTDAKSIQFDVTLNGFGHSPSPLRLAFDPPFLAATLAIAAALLLAGWQAAARFGAPRRPERAIAFGKAALIDNAASLVRKARREAGLGTRYAEMIRERAVRIFGVPARLRDGEVDAYLDRMEGRGLFSALAAEAGNARRKDEMLAAAQALHQWQQEDDG